MERGHFLRVIVPVRSEVVRFEKSAQLWRFRRNGTLANFVSLLQAALPAPYRRTLRSPTTPALVPAGPTVQDAFPILNIVAPHSPHLPRVAGRPFFIVTGWALWISRLSRHLRQYPIIRTVPLVSNISDASRRHFPSAATWIVSSRLAPCTAWVASWQGVVGRCSAVAVGWLIRSPNHWALSILIIPGICLSCRTKA